MKFLILSTLVFTVVLAGCVSATASPQPQPQPSTVIVPGTPTHASPTAQPTLAVASSVLTGHTDRVTLLAWSPDGTRVASASSSPADLVIRLWDSHGRPIAALKGHAGPILSLAWSPDGATLASGSADQTVRFWTRDGLLKRTLHVGRGNVWAAAWSPDGSLLATGSIVQWLNPTVQVWKPDGSLLWAARTQYSGGKFYNLLWSPDGTLLLGGATDYKLWKRDGTEIVSLPGCEHCTPQWGAAWSPDGSMFALGDENGTLQQYDRTGKALKGYQSSDDVNAIAWSPDGRLLAGGREIRTKAGQLLAGVNGRVNSVAWSSDGQYVAMATDMGLWLVRSDGTHVGILGDRAVLVNRVAWSPTSSILASASDDHTVRLWYVPSAP